jgi:Tfp pilus assembly protein PilF
VAHFFLVQARQLAATVVQHTGHAGLQAEGLTILARAYHALGKAQEAYRYYQQVCQLAPAGPCTQETGSCCQRPGGQLLLSIWLRRSA